MGMRDAIVHRAPMRTVEYKLDELAAVAVAGWGEIGNWNSLPFASTVYSSRLETYKNKNATKFSLWTRRAPKEAEAELLVAARVRVVQNKKWTR
jgi:hypothetical protein